jgi:glutathione synthase/RimK-type ligase-like ATP-grasp enzyme
MAGRDRVRIGVWVGPVDGTPPPPETMPIGRAALAVATEGIDTVFGTRWLGGALIGLRPIPGGWEPVQHRPDAIYDRLPMLAQPEQYAAALDGAVGLPIGNPAGLRALCQDKLACQRVLEAAGVGGLPPVESEPARFAERLDDWGAGFLKPRFGSRGVGVRRCVAGERPPPSCPGLRVGVEDPAILQCAVPAPAGEAGWSLRVLCQRDPQGRWIAAPAVLRRSASDPVVNAARGAALEPAADRMGREAHAFALGLALTAAAVLGADPAAIELGVDLAIDRDGNPWILEVNGRPDGRLTGLAALHPERFAHEAERAAARPLQRLASLVRGA